MLAAMKLKSPICRPSWARFFIHQWQKKQNCVFIMSMITILMISTWTIITPEIMKHEILGDIFSNTQERDYRPKLLFESYNDKETISVQESIFNKTRNNQQVLRHETLSHVCG